MYISDRLQNQILRADLQGNISGYAGTGELGLRDGERSQATFQPLSKLYLDRLGNIIVTELGGIRQINPDGTVETLLSEGSAVNAQLISLSSGIRYINSLIFDNQNTMYFTASNQIAPHIFQLKNNVLSLMPELTAIDTFGSMSQYSQSNSHRLLAWENGTFTLCHITYETLMHVSLQGILQGTPTTTGTHPISLSVTDGIQPATQEFEIQVGKSENLIHLAFHKSVRLGDKPVNYTLYTSAGLGATVQNSDESIAVLSSNALQPKSVGTTKLTANAYGNDNYLDAAPVSMDFTVLPNPVKPVFTSVPTTTAQTNTPYEYQITLDNSDGDDWTIASPNLIPQGLSLNLNTMVSTVPPLALANNPWNVSSVTYDANGNLYVLDTRLGHWIRKITPQGDTSFIAGSNISGCVDGVGAAATFKSPSQIIANPNGDLYVSDYGCYSIRKVTPQGEVSTFASGVMPNDIALHPDGSLVFINYRSINIIHPSGVIDTIPNRIGTVPKALAVDRDGTIYFTDSDNSLCVVGPNLVVTKIQQVPYSRRMAIDSNQVIYLSYPEYITRLDPNTGELTQIATASSSFVPQDGKLGMATFRIIQDVVVAPNGDLLIADGLNGIRRIAVQASLSGIPTVAGSYQINLQVSDGANTTTQSFHLLVSDPPLAQAISFPTLGTITYGDGPITLNATSTSGLPVSYQSSNPSVASISGKVMTILGTGPLSITASQPGSGTITAATPVIRSTTIQPKPVTITGVSAKNKIYDGTTKATLTGGTIDGLVNNDNVTVVEGTGEFLRASVGTDIEVTASGYALSGTDADKYTLSDQPLVSPADITKKATATVIVNDFAEGFSIHSAPQGIEIRGAHGWVSVRRLDGRLVEHSFHVGEVFQVGLEKGIYVVADHKKSLRADVR